MHLFLLYCLSLLCLLFYYLCFHWRVTNIKVPNQKSHSVTMPQILAGFCVLRHRLYCQLFYGHHPRSQLFVHRHLFHHSWLYVKTDVSVFRGGAVCWLLLCRSTCFLAFGHWIRKQWWSLSAAVVDSCNWSSTHDIYNPSDTKTSPNVIHNKEIRPHSRSLLSQNNCFCNKLLKYNEGPTRRR